MRAYCILFAVGAWLLQQQADLPPLRYGAFVVAALMLLALLVRRSGVQSMVTMLYAVGCLAAGFLWAAILAHARLADELPTAWEGRDVVLVGTVATLPDVSERGVRFDFDVERVATPGAQVPHRIALAWWGTAGSATKAATLPQINAAERWRLTVRLKRPHGTLNPHAFDYEAWLLERDVRATGYVRGRANAERLSGLVYRPQYLVEALRGLLRTRILQALDGKSYAGVIAALAIGDQRAIPSQQWQVFTRTGVNHLMSISGLHITMVSGLVYALLLALWRRSAWLTLRLPARKAAVIGGFVAALIYTLLAGYAVPAQRTLYMLTVLAVALWFGVASSATTILAIALFLVVALDPWSVLAAGFWLSFGAVAVILFVTLHRVSAMHWMRAWAQTQWAVTVALVPLLLVLFQQVSAISPLTNAFAIPVVSLGVVPLALVGMLLPFDAVLALAHTVMKGCMLVLELLSELPGAVWQQHAPPDWAIGVAVGGALWLLLPRGFPARYLGIVAFLPLYFVYPAAVEDGAARVTVLDVGHGLAVVAQTHHHSLLFDAGPAFAPGSDTGNRIIVPFLRAAGVDRLDTMIISHDDADHHGGAESVLQALPVALFMSSLPDLDPLPLQADDAIRCYAGQRWNWDGVEFEMLHPDRASYDESGMRDNERSCVLKVATTGSSIVLPADIESASERAIVEARGETLRADALVAPHQGSNSSSSSAFLAAVHPNVVIFPVGYRNRFGHPHPDVLARYAAIHTTVYRTDQHGALILTLSANEPLRVQAYRTAYRRYWHAHPEPGAGSLDSGLATFLQ